MRQSKLSNDPELAKKLTNVVGLYINPPVHTIVLSVDEKFQIEALDRTQPGLPLKKEIGSTMTHDYEHNGSTTFFAALNVQTFKMLSLNMQWHRHQAINPFVKEHKKSGQSRSLGAPIQKK